MHYAICELSYLVGIIWLTKDVKQKNGF